MSELRISRRNLLGGALAGGIGLGLTACGKQADSGDGAVAGTKISFLVLGPTQDLTDYLSTTLIPAFTEANGIEVELQTSDWGSAFQKVTTGAASNSLADVLVIGGIWTAPLADKNVLLDLTDRLSGWSDVDQFYPKMLADGAYQERNYAVPIAADIRSGIYRQDILDAAGVTAIPETWDEFRAAGEKMKGQPGLVAPIDLGIDKSIGLQQAFAQFYLQAGGEYWVDGKANFNSEPGQRALSYMVGLYNDGLADANMVYSGSGPRPLAAGQAGTMLQGVGMLGNAATNAPEVYDKLVVGPGLKADSSSESRPVAWVNKLAIAKSSKNPDAAWELLKFAAAKEQLSEISRLYEALPPRRDLADADWVDPLRRQILDTAENAVSQPPHANMLAIGPEINSLLEPAIRGSVGVEETLKAIDAKIDSL